MYVKAYYFQVRGGFGDLSADGFSFDFACLGSLCCLSGLWGWLPSIVIASAVDWAGVVILSLMGDMCSTSLVFTNLDLNPKLPSGLGGSMLERIEFASSGSNETSGLLAAQVFSLIGVEVTRNDVVVLTLLSIGDGVGCGCSESVTEWYGREVPAPSPLKLLPSLSKSITRSVGLSPRPCLE